MGFRRLHNLPASLIHFNYFIHLLCNLHNLSSVFPTRCLALDMQNLQCVKMLHSTEERQGVPNTHNNISDQVFSSFKARVHTAVMCEFYENKLLLHVVP